MKCWIFRVEEEETCSDSTIFNCSKTNPDGEIRPAYLVQWKFLDDFSPVVARFDEEVIWTRGFHNIALFPLSLAKHKSVIC